MPPSRNVHVHWMTLMKNQNAQKCQNFKKRVVRQRTHFLNHLTKKICSMGSKCFRCRSHVQEIILPKNMFSCPLKFILGCFGIFYISSYKPKFSYIVMYECENSGIVYAMTSFSKNHFHFKCGHFPFFATRCVS